MPSLLRRHPVVSRLIIVGVMLLGFLGVLGIKHHRARTLAERVCAQALQAGQLPAFRAALREGGYAVREAQSYGETVLMVEFPAIGIERFVCTVSARGETGSQARITQAQVSFHD
jgi:hypothetical protein